MSQAAQKQLVRMLSETDESLTFEETIDALMEQQNVKEVTAESYVYDYCKTETNERGEKEVTGVKVSSEGRGDDVDRLEKIVSLTEPMGLPTGETFHHLPVLDKDDHPLIPETRTYFTRELDGEVTDLDVITFDMHDPDFYLMLEGHTGTGKNLSVAHVCDNTNRAQVRVNFGLETNKEKIVGMWVPNEHEEGWHFMPGLLTWCAKYGGTFVADEINAAGAEATMPLHGLLEEMGKRYLSIEETGEVLRDVPVTDEEVQDAAAKHNLSLPQDRSFAAYWARVEKWDDDEHLGHFIHPEFQFVATMNPDSYAGTNEANDAFTSRFYTEWMPYMEWKHEVKLLEMTTHLTNSEAESLVKVANRIRARLAGPRSAIPEGTRNKLGMFNEDEGGDIYSPISTRALIKVGRKASLMSAEQATITVLKNEANPQDVNAIDGIITKVF